jgi:hypothetical protein
MIALISAEDSGRHGNVVILKTYDASHLAHLDKAKLADEGIESFIRDEHIVSVSPYLAHAVGAIKLMVFEKDVSAARRALTLDESGTLSNAFEGTLDAPTSCPECGTLDVQRRKSLFGGFLFLFLFFLPVAPRTKEYVCASCGHIWKVG